jgi:hypothetical protein
MSSRQLALPIEAPQPRPRRKESSRLYRAICQLRRFGYPVWRRGGQHLVRGRQVTTRELFMLADNVLPLYVGG